MIRAFAIPCRTVPLLLIVIFSLLSWLALSGGMLGVPLAAIIVSWFFKYAFAMLDRVAEGDDELPILSYEMIHPLTEQRPLGTAVLLYLLYLATQWIDGWAGTTGGNVARLLLLLCVPAIVAVQGVSGSFFAALDPRTWLKLIVRLRGDYASIVVVATLLALLARSLIATRPVLLLPFAIAVPFKQVAGIAILMYGWLALHAFIGTVLFERRHTIGFEPSRSPERLAERERREHDKDLDLVIDRIFAEWRGGAHGNAWRTVEAHLAHCADRTGTLRELFDRIARWPDPRLGNLLAHELLPGLLASRRTGDALAIVRDRVQVDPAFRPQSAADTIKVAELARDAGHRLLARQLLSDFTQRFPGDPAQSVAVRLEGELSR
jgi:hypothetical protein